MAVGVSSTKFSISLETRGYEQQYIDSSSTEEKTNSIANKQLATKDLDFSPRSFLLPYSYKSVKGTDATVVFTQIAEQPICIKIFDPHLSLNTEQEIQFTKLLRSSPHSVFFIEECRVKYEIHEAESRSMILEHIKGTDLHQMIFESEQKFLLCKVFMLAKQGFEFLKALHGKKIIHGDISPKNVMWDIKNKQFVFVDYGASMKIGDEFHKAFSRGFESFEKLLELPPAPSQDIWSFACLLFSAYTGEVLLPRLSMNISLKNYIAFYQKIQCEFGKFSNSLIERSRLQRKNELIKKLKKSQGNIKTWRDRIREVALQNGDSAQEVGCFIYLLERMFAYENRITAEQALQFSFFRDDIGFHIDFSDEMLKMKSKLTIQYVQKDDNQSMLFREKTFDLSEKSIRHCCHHIPRSFTDRYGISIRSVQGKVLFEKENVPLKQDHRLQIAWKA